MAALINPVVCSLFRFKTSWPKPTAEKALCDTETPDNQRHQETPVQTGFSGFSNLLKPLPTWRHSVFRWLVGPVFAASSAADADQGVEGAPNEPAPGVADRTWFDKGLSWIRSLYARISAPSQEVTKRIGYLQWEEYFMAIAFLSAKRSKDPKTQVGACIVNKDKRIVGIGYNGMPNRCSDDVLPWGKGKKLDNKHFYVCHAEMNAIINKNEADVKDCTMYVSLFPCNECAKLIVQSGITKVVYFSDEKAEQDGVKASKRIFELADVNHRPYLSDGKVTVLVDFRKPARDAE